MLFVKMVNAPGKFKLYVLLLSFVLKELSKIGKLHLLDFITTKLASPSFLLITTILLDDCDEFFYEVIIYVT
jgi:hypothetical protein